MKDFKRGLRAGIPIALGYFGVSFTFGIMAFGMGYTWWQAGLVSFLTVTSAGQFAGITTMLLPGNYIAMLVSQLTINVRYSFMSISLAQKTEPAFKGLYRWLLGFFVTDEIFAVAASEKEVKRSFFAGLSLLPWIGWTVGTLLGALLGNVLSQRLLSALGLALYGMFIAIVVPEMKKSRAVLLVALLAIALSAAFRYVPFLAAVPAGFAISICAIAAAVVGAVLFPVSGEEKEAGHE